jgi:hypothetical protein
MTPVAMLRKIMSTLAQLIARFCLCRSLDIEFDEHHGGSGANAVRSRYKVRRQGELATDRIENEIDLKRRSLDRGLHCILD